MILTEADCQRIADRLAGEAGRIKVTVKDQQRGWATVWATGKHAAVSIPRWALHYGELHAVWYVCHEVAHCFTPARFASHGPEFRAKEREFCARFGISITKYRKAYPAEMSAGGQVFYSHPRGGPRDFNP